jgi:RND family efflux transporter MFP subunit
MDQTDAEKAAAKAKYDMSVAEVQRAKTIVKTAEIQLSYTQIKANWTGGSTSRVVGERFVDAGNMLSANTPILTLIDNSIVTAEIDVIERDYPRVKLGQAVQINSDAYPERTFTGKLARLAPTLQESSRQAKAEIDIPNGEGLLKPGMFVRVQIVYAQHADVRVVPVTAIVERDGKQGVFIADSSSMTASFVPLEIGIKDAEFAEVLDAALEGDVIVLGQELLQDGGKIKLPKPKEKDATGKGNNGAKP